MCTKSLLCRPAGQTDKPLAQALLSHSHLTIPTLLTLNQHHRYLKEEVSSFMSENESNCRKPFGKYILILYAIYINTVNAQ